MNVQTVRTNTLYAGAQETTLCDSCSRHLQETIETNAQFCYFPVSFDAVGDWHKGICKEHEYHQKCLDLRFRHK